MTSQILRHRILHYLLGRERESSQLAELEDICSALGESSEDISDQIDILDSLRAIRANRTMGGGAAPMLTGSGKLLLEKLKDEFGSLDIANGPVGEPGSTNLEAPQNLERGDKIQWDVFVSYASEDKEFAESLADKLSQDVSVWFDQFELRVGDSLRRAIDRGLRNSRYGVVILSHHFFQKQWPQRERDGLTALEANGRNVILPVWLGIDHRGVAEHSPTLAELYAAQAADGIETVAKRLLQVILPNPAETAPTDHANFTEIENTSSSGTEIEVTINGSKSRPPGMFVGIKLRHVFGPPVVPQSIRLHSKLIQGDHDRFAQAYLEPGNDIEVHVEVAPATGFPHMDSVWDFGQAPDDLWVIARVRSLTGKVYEVARTFGITEPANQNLFEVTRSNSGMFGHQ